MLHDEDPQGARGVRHLRRTACAGKCDLLRPVVVLLRRSVVLLSSPVMWTRVPAGVAWLVEATVNCFGGRPRRKMGLKEEVDPGVFATARCTNCIG
jgi:hypothetical protein